MTTAQEQEIIAFDESGNTGADLLDKKQPVFILASVRFTVTQALILKNIIQTQSNELKFNRLKKYRRYHSQIISLLNHDLISQDTVRLSIFHKDYCVSVHTVDRLIEPLYYKNGLDLYKNGLNLAYTNLLFFCTPTLCDRAIWEKYKIDFINMFKFRDENSITSFYKTVHNLFESSKSDYGSFLEPILKSREIIHDILRDWDTNNFDSTLSGFINLIDFWGRRTESDFHAYVDDSKALGHFKHLVNSIRDIYIEQQEVGADRRTLQLPLKLIDIIFVNSKDNLVVQIADLIAGAANHYYRALADEKFRDDLSDKIEKTKLINLLHSRVWPHKSFTPEELNTVHNGKNNLLDGLVQLYSKGN